MPGPQGARGRKAKGNNFERAVIKVFKAAGIDCSRNGLTGQTLDQGDILGVRDWTIQCKAYSNVTTGIRQGVDGSLVQQATNGTRWTVAIIKRPNKNVVDSYCVLPLHLFVKLLLHITGLQGSVKQLAQRNLELEQIVATHNKEG